MRTITAADRQTLFDLALQAYGRAELAFDIALQNGLSLSATLKAGQVLSVPTADGMTDEAVTAAYEANGIEPATAPDSETFDSVVPEGVGYWFIAKPAPVFAVSPTD